MLAALVPEIRVLPVQVQAPTGTVPRGPAALTMVRTLVLRVPVDRTAAIRVLAPPAQMLAALVAAIRVLPALVQAPPDRAAAVRMLGMPARVPAVRARALVVATRAQVVPVRGPLVALVVAAQVPVMLAQAGERRLAQVDLVAAMLVPARLVVVRARALAIAMLGVRAPVA